MGAKIKGLRKIWSGSQAMGYGGPGPFRDRILMRVSALFSWRKILGKFLYHFSLLFDKIYLIMD
jgi:hypothetical protein